jgi:hypothetical protein
MMASSKVLVKEKIPKLAVLRLAPKMSFSP